MAFIVFEGLDGSGKSTLIKKLKSLLETEGQSVVLTHEPGGTPLAEEIRDMLLRTEGEAPTALTELLLYEASRAQHVEMKICPALKKGDWVLCDRFTGSTLAFQCGGRNIDRQLIDSLNAIATQGTEPDLWVLLDLSLEESLRRRQRRDEVGEKALDRFELEANEFHNNVRNYYLKLAKEAPKKWLVLNAESSVDDVFLELQSRLKDLGWMPS
ncbi:MAG: dTMP kinase [Bdellovibrionales bacterium]|nr:dTMP kinase [Bdellovibrionales bacterium]